MTCLMANILMSCGRDCGQRLNVDILHRRNQVIRFVFHGVDPALMIMFAFLAMFKQRLLDNIESSDNVPELQIPCHPECQGRGFHI